MEINRDFLKEKWYKYDDEVQFKIGSFPFSNHKTPEVMDMVYEQFDHCLIDWKGITEKDKVFKYTKINKKFLYDFYPEVREFILTHARSVTATLDDEIKN